MIIKRDGKFRMLAGLKRCRLREEEDEEEEDKKRRKIDAQFPLYLLGEVAAGVIAYRSVPPVGFRQSGGEDRREFKAKVDVNKGKSSGSSRHVEEVTKPPLVRTSRGRVQVLPSKYNDSILDNWKKESKLELDEPVMNGQNK